MLYVLRDPGFNKYLFERWWFDMSSMASQINAGIHWQVQANGNLLFPPFRAEDYRQEVHAQVYACLARNTVGTIHSRDVNVRAGKLLYNS